MEYLNHETAGGRPEDDGRYARLWKEARSPAATRHSASACGLSFKDHGKSWEAVYEREHPPGFCWVHESFGTNWRMLEMQAAIGRIQLERMEDWTTRRTENAIVIRDASQPFIEAGEIRAPLSQSDASVHAQYKFYAYVDPARLKQGWSRNRIVAEFGERGVPCFPVSGSEVYLEKAFDGTGWRPKDRLPVTRELGRRASCGLDPRP